jgi:hypothetical protein
VLALLAKHADPTRDGDSLAESEAFCLGEICLQINALADKDHSEESFDEWRRCPIASRARTSQDLALNAWLSARPTNGFMSVLRAHRILFHHIPLAEASLSPRCKTTLEMFVDRHGVSCEKAFALLGTLCQVRYSPTQANARPCHLDVSSLSRDGRWTSTELSSIRRLFVKDLDDLARALPADVIADPLGTFRIMAKTPVIELSDNTWWSYAPILSELLLRSFYATLGECCQDPKLRGRFQNAFGTGVELYVKELFAFAAKAAPENVVPTLTVTSARFEPNWFKRKPEFEVGTGKVRQLIEVKSSYFPPAELFGLGWYKSIEGRLFSEKDGLGQLACTAVARYSGLLPPTPARIQSILVVLEALPTLIPGIQHEARFIFKDHLHAYQTSLPSGLRNCQPALLPVTIISLEELEAMLALATVGYELKDLLDRVIGRQIDVELLPARTVLTEVWNSGSALPTYDWLSPAYDALYTLYDRVFGLNAT